MEKILVVHVPGLSPGLLRQYHESLNIDDWSFSPLTGVFPSLTATVEASFRTARYADEHGIVGSGFWSKTLSRPLIADDVSSINNGTPIWAAFRSAGYRVGQLFWRHSLGQDSDLLVAMRPVFDQHGALLSSLYTYPHELGATLSAEIGRPFDHTELIGPQASYRGTEWIVAATEAVLARDDAPELLLSKLPNLELALQRHGPDALDAKTELANVFADLSRLRHAAEAQAYHMLVFSGHAIEAVTTPVFPNRHLVEHGFLKTYHQGKGLYPDLHSSDAFALVDHQIAHVNCRGGVLAEVRDLLKNLPGVEDVLDREDQKAYHVNHERAGSLILVAANDHWFSYPWWHAPNDAPHYAGQLDFGAKPSIDPTELFPGTETQTSMDPAQVRGSSGRLSSRQDGLFAGNVSLLTNPTTLLELSAYLKLNLIEIADT